MIRNVTKNLAAMQDLVPGVGDVVQTRNGTDLTVAKIDVPYAVADAADMSALEVSVYTNARVYTSDTSFTDYRYDATDLTGIPSDTGSGTWIVARPLGLTKDDVGLDNVDNTSDINKPVSTAQQTALDLKVDTADVILSHGNISNPLCDLKLNSFLDFTGIGSVTFTRADTATYIDRYGVLKVAAVDELRFEAKGALLEGDGTNNALWSADLTNAAWTKVSGTALKDQIGRDGIANSASSFEATAGNATVLQTITIASGDQTYSVAIKRLVGTGDVEITLDGGASWVIVSVTGSYLYFQISGVLANPEFGVRLTTSGDKVAIDTSQCEPLKPASSYIPTTTVPMTRARDIPSITGPDNIPLLAGDWSIVSESSTLGFNQETNQTVWAAFVDDSFNASLVWWEGSELSLLAYYSGNNDGYSVASTPDGRRAPLRSVTTHSSADGIITQYANGILERTEIVPYTDPDGVVNIYIGCGSSSGSASLYGHFTRFTIYDRVLTAFEASIV